MVIFLFGQPGAGKTTLGRELHRRIGGLHLDGDQLREIFRDTDYSEQGRRNNIQRAMDIALYERNRYENVIMSLVCPYNDLRKKFAEKTHVFWVHLNYSEDRGKNAFRVENFEPPMDIEFMSLVTDGFDGPVACAEAILNEIKQGSWQ